MAYSLNLREMKLYLNISLAAKPLKSDKTILKQQNFYICRLKTWLMALKNITKNIVLVYTARFLKNSLAKGIGLMFSKALYDEAFIFVFKKEKIISLHMFFVFYPIDVLFLNKDNEVVELRENVRPFSFLTPKKKAKYVIELPKDIIRKTKTEVGDVVKF